MKLSHGPTLVVVAAVGTLAHGSYAYFAARQDVGRSPVQRARPSGAAHSAQTEAPSDPPPNDSSGGGLAARFPLEYRSIDGANNNLSNPDWGAAEIALRRLAPAAYEDGAHSPAGQDRPSAREISNLVHAQTQSIPNEVGASDYLWQWGQFLDHDLDETPIADPAESFDILVPTGDSWFDPQGTGRVTIPLDRSAWEEHAGQRQQLNLITAYIDASNVYGSDAARASALRTLDGSGRLKTSAGDLLPFNEDGLPNAPSDAAHFFLAGDLRANEQVALTAMHTLFVREHNFWAERLAERGMSEGETIYQTARAIVAAEMQAITYREFLPLLLGPQALPPYAGYRADVDASILNEFATAAYRVGHTMLSPQILRLDAEGSVHRAGHLNLSQAFFTPNEILIHGIEPYLRGLAAQRAQRVDPYLIDDVRNLLFGPPGSGGFDLASLNIQRGRDHGLPSYNDLRRELGVPAAQNFDDISTDGEIQARLSQAYDDVEAIDAWVGLLSEDHAPHALVGRSLRRILATQFRLLRDGDRFWYQAYLPPGMAQAIERQTLARIIRRNTSIGSELADDVFRTP